MTMDQLFDGSFAAFLKLEGAHLSHGVSERSLCGRLAIYLEQLKEKAGLSEYFADVEYNRKQNGLVKTIINKQERVVTIVCDIILHSRGKFVRDDNLIAIEMKKAHRPAAEKELDRERLIAMTTVPNQGVWSIDGTTHPEHVCGYKLGVFVDLDIPRRRYSIEKYEEGKRVSIRSGEF